jgi:hypothetical protein
MKTYRNAISGQMEDAFKEFQNSTSVSSRNHKKTSDGNDMFEAHWINMKRNFKSGDALERHRGENPSCPTFAELYETRAILKS